MNIFEAYRALEQGKCVMSSEDEDVHKYSNNQLYHWYEDRWLETDYFQEYFTHEFEIVDPPDGVAASDGKSLSFKQAVEALEQRKKLVVPDCPLSLPGYPKVFQGLTDSALFMLDLAERRGWKVEEASDET